MTGSIQDIITIVVADNACSPEDASAFWARLPEKVAIALVKAAPKVAFDWVEFDGWAHRMVRRGPGDRMVASVSHPNVTGHSAWYALSHCGICGSLAEAQSAADAHLRANGYPLESGAST